MPERSLRLCGIGLCEHCNTLLTTEDMPLDAMNAEWRCPQCNGILGHQSFGYDRPDRGAKKVRWVGPNGQWTDVMPTTDFQLGNWYIATGRRTFF